MPLTAYRRHLNSCPHRAKGQSYSLCKCPLWAYGYSNGVSTRISLHTTDVAAGLRAMAQLEKGEVVGGAPSITVESAVKAYFDARGDNLASESRRSYAAALGNLVKAGGQLPITAIDLSWMEAYRKSRCASISQSTWIKEAHIVRWLFNWAIKRRWLKENPTEDLEVPASEDFRTLPFSADQIAQLIAVPKTPRATAVFYTLLYTGLRISDVAKLKRSDVDPVTNHLTLRVLKTGVRQKLLLHQDVVASLAALPQIHPQYYFHNGQCLLRTTIQSLRRDIEAAGKAAHITKPKATPHRFRDTFAVELLSNGADIRTVQLLLGHKSVKTTEKHYAHFVEAHQRLLDNAAATLNFAPRHTPAMHT